MFKTLISFVATCSAAACTVLQDQSSDNSEPLRLVTWNLEHLAERNGEGCRPRGEADYAALREHVRQLEADVIAFQEVESAAAAARVFMPDQWNIVISERPDTSRKSTCGNGSTQTIRKQDVGFAIRKGIPFKRNPDVSALGLGNPDLRWAVDVTLATRRPIRLLSVHLKSGCNTGQDWSDRDCPILFNQAPVLEQWIDARARSGEDFAILGDWNRRTALAGDQFLAIVSDEDPPEGKLVFTNGGRGATCQRRYKDFIDHIAVGVRTSARIVPDSFREFRYDGIEENYPSDHCPSLIDLSRS